MKVVGLALAIAGVGLHGVNGQELRGIQHERNLEAFEYHHLTTGNKNFGEVVGMNEWTDCTAYNAATGGCAPSGNRCWQADLASAVAICNNHGDCVGITRDNCGYEPRRGGLYPHVAAHEAWVKQHHYNKLRNDGRPLNLVGTKGIDNWLDCTQYNPATGGCAPTGNRCWQADLESALKICDAHMDCAGITRDNCGYEPRYGGLEQHVAAHETWIKQSNCGTDSSNGVTHCCPPQTTFSPLGFCADPVGNNCKLFGNEPWMSEWPSCANCLANEIPLKCPNSNWWE